jgi:outer membrane protein assembly factor BamD
MKPKCGVRPFLLGAIVLAAAACSSDRETPYVERPPDQIYSQGMRELTGGNYIAAAEQFNEVERQHPYSQAATQSQIMAAYAQYQAMKYDEAIVSLDRFIQLHPGHPRVDYAYYLRALCYYEQISDVRRDQKMTQLALDSLNEVVRRFPDTAYARDARLKLDLAYDHLAGKEMEVGRYYLKRGNYNAAINRFRNVVERYQTTSHVPEALHRLTESYAALGLTEEARKSAAVLGHNYPGSDWYEDSYALVADGNYQPTYGRGQSWIRRMAGKIF